MYCSGSSYAFSQSNNGNIKQFFIKFNCSMISVKVVAITCFSKSVNFNELCSSSPKKDIYIYCMYIHINYSS